MVLFESLALVGGLKDVFLYNRELYMFNTAINQQRIYQTQKMRIEQILLFREDLRELFDLTIGKMDSYLVVNTLTLAFSFGFFYEGRLPHDTPTWLMWLWGIPLASAILFLILSVWFAIYASITAQTLAVRLLTQWIRLPVPSKDDISKAAATAADFEKQNPSALLRVPIVSEETQAGLAGQKPASSSSSTPPEESKGNKIAESEQESYPKMVNPALREMFATEYPSFVEHFHMFQYLQENWAGYDAYARVCMVVGSGQLISVIGYTGIAWYIIDAARWGAAVFTVLLVVFGMVHTRMNLLLSKREVYSLLFLQSAGPVTGCAAAILHYIDSTGEYERTVLWLAPIAFLFHMLTVTFMVAVGSERNGDLPTKYSTVISIDVLGLWDEEHEEEEYYEDSDALTNWQKKWLKATKREAPVSALIPQSVDLTRAEELRKLKPKRFSEAKSLSRLRASAILEGSAADSGKKLEPTKHSKTMAWIAFRQAGGLVILVWIVAIGASIAVAVRNSDIPGWDSDPASHTTASGVALWQPQTLMGSSSKYFANNNFHPLLANFDSVQMVRAVSPEGVHVLIGDRASPREYTRSVLISQSNAALDDALYALKDYSDFGWESFRGITSESIKQIVEFPSGRVPWCSNHDVVTMVEPGVFRDCLKIGHVWHIPDHPGTESMFSAVTGRFGLNSIDRNIHRFHYSRKNLSIKTETRIQVPVELESVVDLAKNEFLMACITANGLLGVWTTLHEEVPSKGVRELPNRSEIQWRSIVGAGGKSFIVFGESRATAVNEAFFINDILLLKKWNRFGHNHR